MTVTRFFLAAILPGIILSACTVHPVARLGSYVGGELSDAGPVDSSSLLTRVDPIEAGLLVINDTGAPDSAPALSRHGRDFLIGQATLRLEEGLPIQVVDVLNAPEQVAPIAFETMLAQARVRGLTHVMLVMVSSAESERPVSMPLTGDPEQAGTAPKVFGFEIVNYALAELALIQVDTGRILSQADGRAWTRLNRLYAPVASNAYPVIHRSLRVSPIYPTEHHAADVLRSIAGDEALEQAVMHLQEAWMSERGESGAARPAPHS